MLWRAFGGGVGGRAGVGGHHAFRRPKQNRVEAIGGTGKGLKERRGSGLPSRVEVFEYYSGAPEPIFVMSCTKSIVSLAVGQAIAEGKIKSIDQPVYDFFPEMKQGRKAAMTVRHLLSMTSGIQNTGSADEIWPTPGDETVLGSCPTLRLFYCDLPNRVILSLSKDAQPPLRASTGSA